MNVSYIYMLFLLVYLPELKIKVHEGTTYYLFVCAMTSYKNTYILTIIFVTFD